VTHRKELELGKYKQLTIDPQLDRDGELEFYFEDGYNSSTFYLTVEDLIKLRDHIDAVLGEGKTHQ
jgi:hypothetical protein